MLELKGITKTYTAGGLTQKALDGVSLTFRECEFVAILGASGSGKTTLLNVIGGLDQADAGDMTIGGRPTKEYKDRDWDAYRNHMVGFVFQNYNLIPHQTLQSNVELSLTLAGVSRAERRARALEALDKVGLKDQAKKKPAQLSGGQAQRVAIARALVNRPEIVLADEPTGALDSTTSVQIMELLKEIARDKLVIMVTHNPKLAERYATRTITLSDGRVDGDTNPPSESETAQEAPRGALSRPSMNFRTALSLSLQNLMTKKARTFMTAFAGSIGIIGIALILSLSSGMTEYIHSVEEETLTAYPIEIESQSVDYTAMMTSLSGRRADRTAQSEAGTVRVNAMMTGMMNAMTAQIEHNDLKSFKKYLEEHWDEIGSSVNAVRYGYAVDLQIYGQDGAQVHPSTLFTQSGMVTDMAMSSFSASGMGDMYDVWKELLPNQTLLKSQYEAVAGRWPESKNELVLVLDEYGQISDYTLYALGLLDSSKLNEAIQSMAGFEAGASLTPERESFTYEELLNLTYRLVPACDYYQGTAGLFADMRADDKYMASLLENAMELRVVGILRPTADAVTGGAMGFIGYLPALTEYVIEKANESDIVAAQKASPETDVLSGLAFGQSLASFDRNSLTDEQKEYLSGLSAAELMTLMQTFSARAQTATYDDNLAAFGCADPDNPSSIELYPADFAAKDAISAFITEYNASVDEGLAITYTDMIGLLLSSVTAIINAISYVLVAFVAISLVVSSIMIGVITYISVLERVKEIGILRALGASKRDVSRVFRAETVLVGLCAGVIGILATLALIVPVNLIIHSLADISAAAALPPMAGLILIAVSVLLTLVAGLLPAKIAARKNPVEALRAE